MTMDRRAFMKRTCSSCLGASAITVLLANCQSTYYTSGTWEPNGISVLKSEFTLQKGANTILRDYIIIRNEKMEFPLCVYRFSENEYSALLMKCTHQGTELLAAGDQLHCHAHGSEFNSRGLVSQGPAEANLRKFNVLVTAEKLLIELK